MSDRPQDRDLELFRDPDEPSADPNDVEMMEESLLSELDAFDMPEADALPRPRKRRVIAVAGAKGGVGKTILATNLALYLASIGRSVVIVDADSQGANVHALLGIDRPGRKAGALPHLAPRESYDEGPTDLVDTQVQGLRLLHGGIDEPIAGEQRARSRGKLLERVGTLDAEYVVVDLGAGTRRSLLDFWLGADVSLFVTIPEPTSIDNTYRFVRTAFARYLRRGATDPVMRRRLIDRMHSMGNAPAPLDLARRLDAAGDPLADVVRESMEEFPFRFVLNQTRLRADLDLGEAMRSATRRRLGLNLDYLGYVDYDDTVWNSVRMRRPLLVESPGAKASKSVEKIARRLLAADAGTRKAAPLRSVPPESHHDLLEVDRGATDEEVRRAYKRMREIYSPDSNCCYALFDQNGMEILRARLEEAHDVLLDPARRRPYELSVFPQTRHAEIEPAGQEVAVEPLPAPPILTPDTEFTGALLRAVRESQGIKLKDVSARTKIGMVYLRAIEHDDFGALPSVVYVRGFVTEIAKVLRLDPLQVSRSYTRRIRQRLEDRA